MYADLPHATPKQCMLYRSAHDLLVPLPHTQRVSETVRATKSLIIGGDLSRTAPAVSICFCRLNIKLAQLKTLLGAGGMHLYLDWFIHHSVRHTQGHLCDGLEAFLQPGSVYCRMRVLALAACMRLSQGSHPSVH